MSSLLVFALVVLRPGEEEPQGEGSKQALKMEPKNTQENKNLLGF